MKKRKIQSQMDLMTLAAMNEARKIILNSPECASDLPPTAYWRTPFGTGGFQDTRPMGKAIPQCGEDACKHYQTVKRVNADSVILGMQLTDKPRCSKLDEVVDSGSICWPLVTDVDDQ